MKRREFIKTSFGALAGLGFPLILPSGVFAQTSDRPTPSNRITMGFIGTGNQGMIGIRNFINQPNVQIVAVCDVNESNFGIGRAPAKRMVDTRYGNQDCKSYLDYRDVLNRGDIDAVYIGTTDHWHAPIMLHALRAGKDIYGQKPLAHTVQEGRWVADAVELYNRVFQTGSQQRSGQTFQRAMEIVSSGRIGKLERVEIGIPPDNAPNIFPKENEVCPPGFDWDFYLGPAPYVPYSELRTYWNWRKVYDLGGGTIMDWVGHHVDIAQWVMGTQDTGPVRFENISSQFMNHPIYNTTTNSSFDCIYANGLKMTVSTTKKFGVKFFGTEGWFFADREKNEASTPSLLSCVVPANECHFYRSLDHAKNFIDCVYSRQEPIAPARYAHRSASVGQIATIAMRLGRSQVDWNPETERFVNDEVADRMLTKSYRGNWFV